MSEDRDKQGRGDATGGTWGRVPGQLRRAAPIFVAAMTVLSGLAYLFAPRDRRSGLIDFEVVAPGRLTRSGQPRDFGWRHLRSLGTRSVVNLRMVDDDERRLDELGFTAYLHLPIPDGLAPTQAQAEAFLRFVRDPANWPVHVHCLRGTQRTGLMVALYRYAVEGWSLDQALREADSHLVSLTQVQIRGLRDWARQHPPADASRPRSASRP